MQPLTRRDPPPVRRDPARAADPLPARDVPPATTLRDGTRPGGAVHREPAPVRRDPAPSRLRYRMQRLWLTPFWRRAVRVGLPLGAVVVGLGLYFGDADRRAAMALGIAEIRQSVEQRPEFMVSVLRIDGASAELDTAIRAALPVSLPESSFRLDLESLRQKVAAFDAVAAVRVQVQPGGILEVAVVERVPAILWRGADGLTMLDETGHPVGPADSRLDRPDLAVIAGEGADRAVPEALRLIAAAQPVAGRLRGLVRMGDRRWDLVLDRGQRILLPATGAVPALERAMAMALAEDMLDRDVTVVDLRNGQRPTLRLSQPALENLRLIRTTVSSVRPRT